MTRESGSVTLILPSGMVRGWYGFGGTAEAPAVLHPPARPVGLIGRVRLALVEELFVEAPLGVFDALRARLRNRPGFSGALLIKATLGFSQPTAPALARRQLGR